MVDSIGPFAIFFGAAAALGLVFYTMWDRVNSRAEGQLKGVAAALERAGMKTKPQELALWALGTAIVLWGGFAFIVRPAIWLGVVALPICVALSIGGFYLFIRYKTESRLKLFIEQLELSLRLMASGLRVGLGLRQALSLVIEEMKEPSRTEFMRVVGQTNIGISAYDAIDDLAQRMPATETLMMARAIRIQSQTGGDLSKVLEQLAETIKDRRRIQRKINALTSEGRASAAVLLVIPFGLGLFIVFMQPTMGHALLFTSPGHIALAIVVLLEAAGAFWLNRLLQVDV